MNEPREWSWIITWRQNFVQNNTSNQWEAKVWTWVRWRWSWGWAWWCCRCPCRGCTRAWPPGTWAGWGGGSRGRWAAGRWGPAPGSCRSPPASGTAAACGILSISSLQYKICMTLINDNVILCFLLAVIQLLCHHSVLPHDHCRRLQSTALLHAVIMIPYNGTPELSSLVMSQHWTDDNKTWAIRVGR